MRQFKILFLQFIEFHFQSFETSTLRTTITEKYRKVTVGKTGNFKFPERQLLTQQQIVNNYCIVRFDSLLVTTRQKRTDSIRFQAQEYRNFNLKRREKSHLNVE